MNHKAKFSDSRFSFTFWTMGKRDILVRIEKKIVTRFSHRYFWVIVFHVPDLTDVSKVPFASHTGMHNRYESPVQDVWSGMKTYMPLPEHKRTGVNNEARPFTGVSLTGCD